MESECSKLEIDGDGRGAIAGGGGGWRDGSEML